MEQFVLVLASACNNKKLNTQAVTKQKLPKYEGEQTSTYIIDSILMKINRKLFAKADSLVDELFSCPGNELSISQTLR